MFADHRDGFVDGVAALRPARLVALARERRLDVDHAEVEMVDVPQSLVSQAHRFRRTPLLRSRKIPIEDKFRSIHNESGNRSQVTGKSQDPFLLFLSPVTCHPPLPFLLFLLFLRFLPYFASFGGTVSPNIESCPGPATFIPRASSGLGK